MWEKLANFILKNRLILLAILMISTVFMGYHARKSSLNYSFSKVIPENDPNMKVFAEFKRLFGEDGNILAIGIKDSSLFNPTNFRRLSYLSDEIASLPGISSVLSLPNLPRLIKNKKKKAFIVEQIFKETPSSQKTLDSLLEIALNQKFYSGRIINKENGMILMLVSYDKSYLNSNKRVGLTNAIIDACSSFTKYTNIHLYMAGMPFVRSVVVSQVKEELELFLLYSALITALIMLLFFRSWVAVVFPLLIIVVVVIWVLGITALLGFKITLLTGLIPSIIVVIGIPNSIYLINKYHQEYLLHGDKIKAIKIVTQKIGLVTLITNGTTAVGFGVLMFTKIIILKEFGVVASVNVMVMFLVSIIMMPIVFSYLPPPSAKHLRHLSFSPLKKTLVNFHTSVTNYRFLIFAVTTIMLIFAFYGISLIYSDSRMTDDIPEESKLKHDLTFFEENFSGVMPLEIVVDTHKKKGFNNLKNLQAIDAYEKFLSSQPDISTPISIISFIKASRQAYFNGNPARYSLPKNNQEKNFILGYIKDQSDNTGLLKSFVDSTGQKIRISLKIKDIGSRKLDSLISNVIKPKQKEFFKDTPITASITGSTLLFIKGNSFLISNLKRSFILAFIIISIIMGGLFRNVRMIILSLIPNVIPLLITAGIMGYLGIPLKPSTSIIFSIAFGISVDNTIHFLAKYRQELYAHSFNVKKAIELSMKETGISMIYTTIVLFSGFVIFTASEFGGTVALGLLTSITLLIALFTNLILLPSLLITFDSGKRKLGTHPIIEEYDGVSYDDEEIALDKIKHLGNGQQPKIIEKNKKAKT